MHLYGLHMRSTYWPSVVVLDSTHGYGAAFSPAQSSIVVFGSWQYGSSSL